MTTHARNLPEGSGQPAPPPPPPDMPALLARLAAAETEHTAAAAAWAIVDADPATPLAVWFPIWDRLVAAGFQQHRYVQPNPPLVQGGCVSGWYLGTLGQDTTGVQIAMLTLYGDRLRENQGWDWDIDRRGIPCLQVLVPEVTP